MSGVTFQRIGNRRHRVPSYNIATWRLAVADGARTVFRPTFRTFLHRLGFPVVALLLFLPLYQLHEKSASVPAYRDASTRPPTAEDLEWQARTESATQELRQLLPEDEFRRFEEEQARQQAARDTRYGERDRPIAALHIAGDYVYYTLAALLALLALLPPLSVLWNHVTLQRDPRNHLVVRAWYGLPRRRSWPIAELRHALLSCNEHVTFARRGAVRRHGWRWRVTLGADPGANPPVHVPMLAEFIVHHQNDRPRDDAPPPPEVLRFLQALYRLTGLHASAPLITDAAIERGRFGRRRVIQAGRAVGAPHVEHTVFQATLGSLDEIPEHLRPRLEQLIDQARREGNPIGKTYKAESSTIVIRDAQGREQVYHSLDEMPPDVRAMYEDLRRHK